MILASKTIYRPDLQGLRAIAIIVVILNHAESPLFPGGFIGVDVFFVLSGYLITAVLTQEHADSGTIILLNFFARRLKRLLPALLVMLSIVVLAGSFLLPSYQLTQQIGSLNFAATWSSNLFFSLSTIDYFSDLKTKDFFLHTWSLGIEEQFYLIWPLIILLSFFIIKNLKIESSTNLQLAVLLTPLALFSFGLSQYWTITKPIWSFYMMPSRIWQFLFGATSFIWIQHKETSLSSKVKYYSLLHWNEYLGFIGLALIFISAISFHSYMTYPGILALLPSIGAALVIYTGHSTSGTVVSRILKHPSLVWIGDRSYSWYLWHWPILMLGFSLGIQHFFDRISILVLLSLVIAIISYRYIEIPFWKGRFSNTKPFLVLIASTLAMLLLIFLSQKLLNNTTETSNNKTTFTANKVRTDIPIIYNQGCDAWHANSDVNPCMFGDVNSPKSVVLLGDSITAQWFSLFPEIFTSPQWHIIVLTKSSCPMVDEDFFYTRIGKVYDVCNEWRNAVIKYLESVQPNIIFVGNTASINFSERQWVDGSARVFSRLSKAAKDVIVFPGTYQLSFDGPSCIERNLSPLSELSTYPQLPECTEKALTSQADTVANYLKQAASQFQNVKLLNLNDLVCPDSICSAISSSGLIVFRDQQHLTNSFVKAQVSVVRERLRALKLESFSN